MLGRSSQLSHYMLAVGVVLTATLVRFFLGLFEPNVLYFAVYYPAVMMTALWWGTGPALTAVAIAAGIAWYVFHPALTMTTVPTELLMNLTLFALCCGVMIWVADQYRQAIAGLKSAEERRDVLIDELKHRSRNSLAVAGSVIQNSLQSDPETAQRLIARLRILLGTDSFDVAPDLHDRLLSRLTRPSSSHMDPTGWR